MLKLPTKLLFVENKCWKLLLTLHTTTFLKWKQKNLNWLRQTRLSAFIPLLASAPTDQRITKIMYFIIVIWLNKAVELLNKD